MSTSSSDATTAILSTAKSVTEPPPPAPAARWEKIGEGRFRDNKTGYYYVLPKAAVDFGVDIVKEVESMKVWYSFKAEEIIKAAVSSTRSVISEHWPCQDLYFGLAVQPVLTLLRGLVQNAARSNDIPDYRFREKEEDRWIIPLSLTDFRKKYLEIMRSAKGRVIGYDAPSDEKASNSVSAKDKYEGLDNDSSLKQRINRAWDEFLEMCSIMESYSWKDPQAAIKVFRRFHAVQLDSRGADWIKEKGVPKVAGKTEEMAEELLKVFLDDIKYLLQTVLPEFDIPIEASRYRQVEEKYEAIGNEMEALLGAAKKNESNLDPVAKSELVKYEHLTDTIVGCYMRKDM
ncbi:hypothetical protein BJ508DRAFT_22432 [Ascobolus immersus RN42]|uniref:Uncharacterized protein n=1 Tax=Ascobolus immersus RN42 TaxID=1160509 RepID=A0A3N4HPU8_ASCIM|nr:hypothetical protein BJ508DRAFT_22432 [Ascobolus immersus RN42]